MYNNKLTPRTLIIWLIVVAAVVFGAWFVYITIDRHGKASVEIYVVPHDASVEINDNSYRHGQTVYLEPDEWTATASRAGFVSAEQTLIIQDPSDDNLLFIFGLEAESEEAVEWASENQDAYFAFEGRMGEAIRIQSEQMRERNPLIGYLPIQKPLYRIGYKADPEEASEVIITIHASNGYWEAALDELRGLSINLSDYKIEYVDRVYNEYRNPFVR